MFESMTFRDFAYIGGVLITLGTFYGGYKALVREFREHAKSDAEAFSAINDTLSTVRESVARLEGKLDA